MTRAMPKKRTVPESPSQRRPMRTSRTVNATIRNAVFSWFTWFFLPLFGKVQSTGVVVVDRGDVLNQPDRRASETLGAARRSGPLQAALAGGDPVGVDLELESARDGRPLKGRRVHADRPALGP